MTTYLQKKDSREPESEAAANPTLDSKPKPENRKTSKVNRKMSRISQQEIKDLCRMLDAGGTKACD